MSSRGEEQKRPSQLLHLWQELEEEAHVQGQVLGQV